MAVPIEMPQLGESVVKGAIIRWLKEPGDAVNEYDPLVEVETDKVVTEVTARQSGVLLRIVVPAGETAQVGAILAYLGESEDEAIPEQTSAEVSSSMPVPASTISRLEPATPAAAKPARFSPVVLRIAAEHDVPLVELQAIKGQGKAGRVRKRDFLAYLETRPSSPSAEAPEPLPEPAQEPLEPGAAVELSPMRAAIAEHMLRSVQTSPHVTSIFEVDMSRVAAYRQAHRQAFERQGFSLGYTAFFVQAAVEALRGYPLANASIKDGQLMLHSDINIGLAVAVAGGLLVPVIKQAQALSLAGLVRAIDALAGRARTRQLTPDEVQGGTFTVTNPGMQGALLGTAIIHQPQAAILGVGAIVKRPVVIDDAIAIRPMVYLCLTYDHRIMDGFGANQVLGKMKDYLESYS
jgi:2-oxoglutarate dehydrogenase E2 component (dihydrolipoamide succinyltransferase)